jgi:amino acid transporter
MSLFFGAILPVVVFNYVGFELQNGAGQEMTNPQRDVPRTVIRSGLICLLGYGVVIGVAMFTLPASQLGDSSGFASGFFLSFQNVLTTVLGHNFGVALGWLIAVGLIIAVSSSGGTWIIGADRTYAIATLDKTGPSFLGRFSSRFGTPIAVNMLSGCVASVMLIVSIAINTYGSAGSTVNNLFGIVLGFTISTTTLSYLFIFPSYLILKYKFPNLRRAFAVPGGLVGAWIVTLLPLVFVAVASYIVLWPLDASITAGVSRQTYEITQFTVLGAIVLLTVIFYIWGRLEKKNRDVLVEVNLGEGGMTSELPMNVALGDD